MKNYILLVIILLTFSIIFLKHPLAGEANQAGETYYVGTDILNVRKTADANGEIIGQLKLGDKITVFSEQFGWSEIIFKNEKAWLASHLLTKTAPLNLAVNKGDLQIDKSLIYRDVTVRPLTRYHHLMENNKMIRQDKLDPAVQSIYDRRLPKKLTNWLHKQDSHQPLTGYAIIIDPGHGGFDPGSSAVNGDYEKDHTLRLSLAVADYLQALGAHVTLSRDQDVFVSLNNRALLNTVVDADVFISIHFNAFESKDAYGLSSHFTRDEESKRLATAIHHPLIKLTQMRDRGVLDDHYYVLKENSIPATLLELGYITNDDDFRKISSPSFEQDVANAIWQGLAIYFNIRLAAL